LGIFEENKQVLAHTHHLFQDHLNGRTRSKKVSPQGMLTNEEDKTLMVWALGMQDLRISITLQ
jgi:hypothetical protein